MTQRKRVRGGEPPAAATPQGEPIHTKYRPRDLRGVVGHGAVVRSLEATLGGRSLPHCYLFTGPAGTGKTTLARIVAERLGVPGSGVTEVDAAKATGVDDMRTLTDGLRYGGFGDSPNKAIVLNECHRLSAQAWDSLLMSTEEPPPHAFFFFTSTSPEKIPKAMLTRCQAYDLAPVRFEDLMDMLEEVSEKEGMDVPAWRLTLVAQAAQGSPRSALTMLAKVHALPDEDDVRRLLAEPLESPEVIDLCRMMVKGELEWKRLTAVLRALDMPAESVRIVVANYLAGCLMNPKGGEKEVVRLLDMLECFSKPFNASDKAAPLLVAFGRVVYPA